MFEGVQCTHILCFIGVTLKQWLRNLVHLKLFSQFCLASKVPAYQLVHAIEHFERISCTLSHLCILSYLLILHQLKKIYLSTNVKFHFNLNVKINTLSIKRSDFIYM